MKKQWQRIWFYIRRLVATWWTMLRRFAAKPGGQVALILIVCGVIAAAVLIRLISQIPIYREKDHSGNLSVNLAQPSSSYASSDEFSTYSTLGYAYSSRTSASRSQSSAASAPASSEGEPSSTSSDSSSSSQSSSSASDSSSDSSSEPSSSSSTPSSSSQPSSSGTGSPGSSSPSSGDAAGNVTQ